jgi:hypothetical protein
VIGSIYYLASHVHNLVIGKQIVFSPIIGFPLTIIGWPQMVYADIIHLQSLGLKFPTVLVLVLLLSMICYVITTIFKESQTTHS